MLDTIESVMGGMALAGIAMAIVINAVPALNSNF